MNEYRDKEIYGPIRVCVDAYEQGALSGRFYHTGSEQEHVFLSATQFLLGMKRILENEHSLRTQADAPAPEGPPEYKNTPARPGSGKLATFTVWVLFRQHTDWQGKVVWHEENRMLPFRSVLELLRLLDSALRGRFETKPP